MEKEKLIIKNFGPIKSVELDLGRFNILIGEQATGKSTVAKVLAVCRYFSYIHGSNAKDFSNSENSQFYYGLVAWGLREYINDNSYISYKCEKYSLVADNITQPALNASYFRIVLNPLSQQFKNLLEELKKIQKISGLFSDIPTSFFLNDVKNVMDNPFYLPTERGLQSIFSLGQGSIPNIANSLFNQFARLDQIARTFKKETFIEPLNIYYQNRDGYGYIRKANEKKYYSLNNAASGYQALIPVILVVKYYTELRKKSKTFIIEEPELDVFPKAQNKLIQYLSENAKIFDSMVFYTTHSPYTLTSVNNLMYAYQVGQNDPEKVSKIIDKKYWINPDDLSVYMLMPDGNYENIKDDDGLIKAEKIDEVSKIINKDFNAIMDIELGVDETNE